MGVTISVPYSSSAVGHSSQAVGPLNSAGEAQPGGYPREQMRPPVIYVCAWKGETQLMFVLDAQRRSGYL